MTVTNTNPLYCPLLLIHIYVYRSPTQNQLTVLINPSVLKSSHIRRNNMRYISYSDFCHSRQLPYALRDLSITPFEWLESVLEYNRRVTCSEIPTETENDLHVLLSQVCQNLIGDSTTNKNNNVDNEVKLWSYVNTSTTQLNRN